MAYPLMTHISLRLLGVAYYLFTGTPAACSDTHRSTDTPLAGMTRQPHPIHHRAASHRVSGVAARELATDEDDFAEVFLVAGLRVGRESRDRSRNTSRWSRL
jgi:hypothetical protein